MNALTAVDTYSGLLDSGSAVPVIWSISMRLCLLLGSNTLAHSGRSYLSTTYLAYNLKSEFLLEQAIRASSQSPLL